MFIVEKGWYVVKGLNYADSKYGYQLETNCRLLTEEEYQRGCDKGADRKREIELLRQQNIKMFEDLADAREDNRRYRDRESELLNEIALLREQRKLLTEAHAAVVLAYTSEIA